MGQKPSFKELKAKVGVDEVAYSLGYRLNRKAGVGRWFEMVLLDGQGHAKDTLIIKNTSDKASQIFFRRDGQRADVLAFIKENLNSFNTSGRNDWEKVENVLRAFANEPPLDYQETAQFIGEGGKSTKTFDPDRWETGAASTQNIGGTILCQRGLSEATIEDFAPFIQTIKDVQKTSYQYSNVGFPYKEPGSDKVVGYEIRGQGGFKSKAAGTNSSTAAWIVDMGKDKDPTMKKNVYFAESAFDIMAFYQYNKATIDKETSVFISTGGTFSESQIKGMMSYYNKARAIDCFDNDVPGRIYGIRMAALLEGIPLQVYHHGAQVEILAGNKRLSYQEEELSLTRFSKDLNLRYKVGTWKAPDNFKDWNDVIMKQPQKAMTVNKIYQRNERLAQSRQSKMKM